MNRLKLLAAVALLGIPLAACEEATPPPPVGSITGTVSIEGTGVDGVSVNLSNGNSTTTAGGGSYRFDNVEGGAYTVTISGFPSDATFDATSAAATITSAGQSVTVNFSGAYIRTASVMGTVTVENMGLPGVTVTLTGVSGASAVTDDSGQYAFTGLRMGAYSVEISSFDSDEVGFSSTSASVTVGVGESKIVSFDGTYLRTAGIMGRVSVDGEGLPNVTVSLAGGPDNTDMTTMTDAAGQYSFAKLRGGDYAVGISGYDTDDYEFEVTSQNVTVALGETASVPFEGVLLRTSGISGRVSVEGMGLEDVTVTLSMADADDMTTMTDVGGTYAFAGLAAGDYTVSIAVDSDAYVFDSMSMDVTVGDDETAIANFEGEHARTASVTVQLFIDEGTKNDMMDDGEMTFPTAEMLATVAELGLPLALPISLAGPGVHDMQYGTAMPDGSVVFSGLRAGSYQVIVTDISDETLAALPPALAHVLRDYAYGGPATGYPLEVAVGQQAKQYAPVDITHTTVHFGVTLKGGETRGMPLPGAMVTLFADPTGDTKIADGMTMVDEATGHAVASIRIARDGTSGNMVYAGVSAEGYYAADDMTTVKWDPQKTYTTGANDNNILNLNVDVSVSGATITTEYGGGDPLAGWAISIEHGDVMEEDMLDDDGMASFTMELPEAVLPQLPKSFTFSVDEDQDDDLDGGEMFEATSFEYMHTGLMLAGTVEGMMEATYTTQTLKVYVHEELDQVRGYTGNVGHGDERNTGLVDLEIRQATGNEGRFTSPIATDDWDAKANTDVSGDTVYIFSHLPADMDIVVRADAKAGYKLLDLDRIDTYRNMDENGVMGGAFGDMGGFGHTVTLCPLTETEPTGQDFGKCGAFAVVELHDVSALVWMKDVGKSGTTFKETDPKFVSGIEVSLEPVEGKNLVGVGQSFTTAKSNDPATDNDDRKDFDFVDMAAGAYDLGLPDDWRARIPADTDDLGDHSPKGATGMVGDALSPLAGDVMLDITPSTAIVYGFVRNNDGVGLEGINVSANGVETTTDELGRYIAKGVGDSKGKITVTTTLTGYPSAKGTTTFEANTVSRVDITRSGANNTVAITGTVTESGTGTPIKGVEIRVDGKKPLNAGTGKVLTDEDGEYTALVAVQPNNDPLVTVAPRKSGYHFVPASSPVAALAGANPTANFQGYPATEIVGRVTGAGGSQPSAEVEVIAYRNADHTSAIDSVVTTETGTFSIHVPTLSGTVYLAAKPQDDYTPSHPNYLALRDAERYNWFDPPTTRAGGQIAVIPGQTLEFGTFSGYSVQPRITRVRRGAIPQAVEEGTTITPDATARGFSLVQGEPTDTIVVTWRYDTRNPTTLAAGGTGPYSAADAADNAGLTTALGPRYTTFAAPSGGFSTPASFEAPATSGRGNAAEGTSVTHTRTTTYIIPEDDDDDYRDIRVKIGHVVNDASATARDATAALSAAKDLAGVAHGAMDVVADRDIGGGVGADPVTDEISASWSGPGSPQLEQRIALEVFVESTRGGTTVNGWEWIVAGTITAPTVTRDTDPETDSGEDWGQWNMGDFDLNLPANIAADGWVDDDNAGLIYTVTQANLRKARNLRVDTRVDNTGTWKKGTPAAIPSS